MYNVNIEDGRQKIFTIFKWNPIENIYVNYMDYDAIIFFFPFKDVLFRNVFRIIE